jgi:UDP-N-acetylmuramyl pentapeptide phosphotransferase/UDP-N-acetylglucosamine-1-phosphate transferase
LAESLAGMSHLATMLVFAVLASMALACLTQRSTSGRIRYAVVSFVLFVLIGVGIAWLMYPFSR